MADDSDIVGQDEIEKLLEQSQGKSKPPPPDAKPEGESSALGQDEIEALVSGSKGEPPEPPSPPSANADDSSKILGQNEIESLLSESAGAKKPKADPARASADRTSASLGNMAAGDIEFLLNEAESALASINAPSSNMPSNVLPFNLDDLTGATPSTEVATLELIRDVELDLRIELGRTHMYLEDVLKLRKGSVVPLDKLAGDPVDIFVNGRLIARGEVLVLNDNFCIRVAELIAGETSKVG